MDINRSENYLLKNFSDSIEVYERLLTIEEKLREQTPLQKENLHGEADQASRFIKKLIRRQELVVLNLQKKVYHHVINETKTNLDYFQEN